MRTEVIPVPIFSLENTFFKYRTSKYWTNSSLEWNLQEHLGSLFLLHITPCSFSPSVLIQIFKRQSISSAEEHSSWGNLFLPMWAIACLLLEGSWEFCACPSLSYWGSKCQFCEFTTQLDLKRNLKCCTGWYQRLILLVSSNTRELKSSLSIFKRFNWL